MKQIHNALGVVAIAAMATAVLRHRRLQRQERAAAAAEPRHRRPDRGRFARRGGRAQGRRHGQAQAASSPIPRPAGFGGSSIWEASGLMSDEFMNSDFQNSQNDVDARTMTSGQPGRATTSIRRRRAATSATPSPPSRQFEPQKTADIGELYMALGFIEMTLAENFCNGIPLGTQRQRRRRLHVARLQAAHERRSVRRRAHAHRQRAGDSRHRRPTSNERRRSTGHADHQGAHSASTRAVRRGGGARSELGDRDELPVSVHHAGVEQLRRPRHLDAQQLDRAHVGRRQLRRSTAARRSRRRTPFRSRR